MKTALLICDHIPEDMTGQFGKYESIYQDFLPQLNLVPFLVVDEEYPNIEEFDAFVCTGSKLSVYDSVDWIDKLKAVVKNIYQSRRKFIGVCFGHQLIAESLGGEVLRSNMGFLIGVHQFKYQEIPPWAPDSRDQYSLPMLCQDQVHKLPPDSTVYASSPECPVGMYTVSNHFIGIQGHPEFSKELDKAFYDRRAERISEDKRILADASMSQSIDQKYLRQLIYNFIDS